MLSLRDLQDLEAAAKMIVCVIERHHVHEEDAADRRARFLLQNNVIPFPKQKPQSNFSSNTTLKEINSMLVEMKINLTARERPDGRFEIRPYINGKRISIYGKDANEISRKYRNLLKSAKREEKSSVTLYGWFSEWLEIYKQPNVAANTYKNLVYCIEKHIKANLADKPLNKFTLTDLTKTLNMIESSRMRKYARGILCASFAQAVTVGYIKDSPARNLATVKHVSKKGKAIPLLDLKDMIERAAEQLRPEMFRYFIFCLFSGARRDEALNIRGGDCDMKNKIVHIPGTKSEGSDRRIPMFPILEKIITLSKATKFERVFNVPKYRANRDYQIFKGAESESVQHWLRHTFGTIQICVLQIPANTVSLWMGHADPSITMDIYTHPEDLAPDIYYSGLYSETEKLEI